MMLPAPTPGRKPDVFVLSGVPLRPGVRIEDTSRFVDATWQLGHAVHRLNVRSLTLCFDHVPQPFRTTAKQLCLAMLSGALPPGEQRPRLDTVHTGFREAVRFLKWVDARPEARFGPLASLTGADLLDYQDTLRRTVRSVSGRNKSRSSVRWLWRWRDHLTDCLAFDPRHLQDCGEPQNRMGRENRTQRIPEDVMGPLFVWALRFIDHFAPDICAADGQWRRQRWGMPVNRADRVSPVSTRAALEATLDTYLARNRPLPGWRGQPNLIRIARQTGYHRAMFRDPELRLLVESVASVVGIAETAGFDLDIRGCSPVGGQQRSSSDTCTLTSRSRRSPVPTRSRAIRAVPVRRASWVRGKTGSPTSRHGAPLGSVMLIGSPSVLLGVKACARSGSRSVR